MVYELEVGNNILPCPYCGEKPIRLQGVETKKYWITCYNSHCLVSPETKHYRIKGLDVMAWNKRKVVT